MGTLRTFAIACVCNTSMSFDCGGIIAEIDRTIVLRPTGIRTAIVTIALSVPCPFIQKYVMVYFRERYTETEETSRLGEGRSRRWADDQERMVSVSKGMVGRRSNRGEPTTRI